MKVNIKIATLLVINFFILVIEANATHFAGGDIEYTCVGLRKWKVTLTLYRFCDNGANTFCSSFACTKNMTATPSPQISGGGLNPNGCSGPSINLTVSLVKVEDAEKKKIDYCGAQSKNACTNLGQVAAGPYRPSVEKYIFEGILDLSAATYDNACPYYDLYFNECCRNSTTNVNGQPGFAFKATLNIHDRSTGSVLKNNSPKLLNEAIITFTAQQHQVINAGAVDPDGDSLSYKIIKSLQGVNSDVSYYPPYSEYVPFPLNQGLPPHNEYPWAARLVLDTVNGDISLNAKNTGLTPIAGDMSTEITQWAFKIDSVTGQRVSYITGITMRNLQIYSVPDLTSTEHTFEAPRFETHPTLLNGKPKFNHHVLAGDLLCFTVTAKDSIYPNYPDRIDTTYISWNNGLSRPGKLTFAPDYDITQGRPREDRWKFCWETDSSDARDLPYYFSVIAYDNNCPDPGKIQQGFSIKVNSDWGDMMKSYSCPDWLVQVRKIDMERVLDSAKLEVARLPDDFSFSGGADIYKAVNPNPGGNNPVAIMQQKLRFKQLGRYLIRGILYYTDSVMHTKIYYDTIHVKHIDSLNISVEDKMICRGDSITIIPDISGGVSPFSYKWKLAIPYDPIIGMDSILKYKPLFYSSPNNYYYLEISDAHHCLRRDTFIIGDKRLSNITPANGNTCTNTPILFKALVNNNWKNYQSFWQVDTIASSRNEFTTSFNSPGIKNIKLVVSDSTGCADSLSTSINIHAVPEAKISATTDTIQCVTGNFFKLYTNKQTGVSYTWKLDNITRTDTFFNNSFAPGDRLLKLKVSNQFCSDSSEQHLRVVNRPGAVIKLLSDSVQCLFGNRFNVSTPTKPAVSQLWKYEWLTSTDTFATLQFSSIGIKSIKLIRSSWKNCTDSSEIKVRIKEMPGVAEFNLPSGTIYKDTVYQYSVTPQTNYKYQWSGNNVSILSFDTSNTVDVRWLATGAGTLRLSQILDGCPRMDSVMVMVNGYVGLKEHSKKMLVHVYPNPNKGSFVIGFNALKRQHITIKLYNTLGVEVLAKQTELEAGVNNLDMQTELPGGIYLLTISDGISTTTQRVIINK